MGWEWPLSTLQAVLGRVIRQLTDGGLGLVEEHVRLMTVDNPHAMPGGRGMSILNVGYGLGIVRPLSCPLCAIP